MSFAKEVKEEITKIKSESCCETAELKALLTINSEVALSRDGLKIEFQTTNPGISRRMVVLLHDLYDVEIELLTKARERLNRSCFYIIRIIKGAEKIIKDTSLLYSDQLNQDIQKECCKKAYLRGAFLASGSINDPNSSYHLEISCNDEKEIVFIQRLMNEENLNAKITRRRNNLIVYLKEAGKIGDFLNLIGSQRMYFQYEDMIIKRDISNSINRVINCELANELKTQESSKKQIKEIKVIQGILSEDKIDIKMKQAMDYRLNNPDASLNEIVELAKADNLSLTKSGLNHRFRKIHELYMALMENSGGNHD